MYYGSTGSELKVKGNTSTTANPTGAQGFYNSIWGNCSGWGNPGNYSMYNGWREGADPKLNTGQTGTSNISMNTGYRYKDRMFGCNVTITSAGGFNGAGFTSPFVVTQFGAAGTPMYKNMSMSNNQNFITTTASAGYGYIFAGWYLESNTGVFLTSTANVSWYFNGTYGNKSFAYIKNLHARFQTSKSDRRLKENIRLIGKSIKGINIYTWTYKNQELDGKGTYQGVMAQEVPHAAIQHPDGYLMVDYSKVDVIFKKVYGSNMGN